VQLFWISYFLLQPMSSPMAYGLYFILVILELLVPVIAERKNNTPWHRHHIIERYGLLNIIVLGETLLAGGLALQQIAGGSTNITFILIALSSLVIVFSMWWLYFSQEEHLISDNFNHAFAWGYGHIVIFASGAAVGAGLAAYVDIVAGHAKVPLLVGEYAVAIPVAMFMLGLWFVRDRFHFTGTTRFVMPIFAILVLFAPFIPFALETIAVLTALSVVVRSNFARREAQAAEF
jgi:low temperature requirement protein LtrA